jgi:hypothetical protein
VFFFRWKLRIQLQLNFLFWFSGSLKTPKTMRPSNSSKADTAIDLSSEFKELDNSIGMMPDKYSMTFQERRATAAACMVRGVSFFSLLLICFSNLFFRFLDSNFQHHHTATSTLHTQSAMFKSKKDTTHIAPVD